MWLKLISRIGTYKKKRPYQSYHFSPSLSFIYEGTAIWHPRCGPGPTENGTVLNGSLSNGHHVNGEQKAERERDFDGMSSTASETQVGNQGVKLVISLLTCSSSVACFVVHHSFGNLIFIICRVAFISVFWFLILFLFPMACAVIFALCICLYDCQ